jgi:hypothetical protein
MNGRLYDPQVGRMLSVDNYTHTEQNTQGFNRYSYAQNNPLKYKDPDGEHPVLFLAVGMIMLANRMMQGKVETTGQFVIGMASVFLMPTVGSFAGGMVNKLLLHGANTGFVAGLVSGATSGFVTGFAEGAGSAYLAGQSNIGRTGLMSGLGGAAFGGILGGMSGGIQASNSGRDFWTGSGRQYKSPPTYYAGDGTGYNPDFPEGTTLNVLEGGKRVYYKPDNGLYGMCDYVDPGNYIMVEIDGVVTSKTPFNKSVYKIPNGSGRLEVAANGEPNLVGDFSDYGFGYGWQERSYFTNPSRSYWVDRTVNGVTTKVNYTLMDDCLGCWNAKTNRIEDLGGWWRLFELGATIR